MKSFGIESVGGFGRDLGEEFGVDFKRLAGGRGAGWFSFQDLGSIVDIQYVRWGGSGSKESKGPEDQEVN